jgi:phage baseplate assembly protein W
MKAISIPFRFTGEQVRATDSYDEIVRGQVLDAIMTNQGERIFRPRYGCDVQSAVFDPRDELIRKDAAGIIKRRLEQFVPRAFIRDVSISAPGEEAIVYIRINYRSSAFSNEVDLTVPLPSSEFFARSTSQLGA